MSAPDANEPRPCPSCDAELAPEAVICIRCGFDTRTGQKLGEGKPAKAKKAKKARSAMDGDGPGLGLSGPIPKLVGFVVMLALGYAATYPLRTFFASFTKLAKEGVKPPPPPRTVQQMRDSARASREASRPRPTRSARPTDDPSSENYLKFQAAVETTSQKTDMLTVEGPGIAVSGIVEGFTGNPFWPEITAALQEAAPGVPLTVACVGDSNFAQVNYYAGRYTLRLKVAHASLNDGLPIATTHYAGPIRKETPSIEGLNDERADLFAAVQIAGAKMEAGLPAMVAMIAAKIPAVAERAAPLAGQWLAGDDASRKVCACAFCIAKQTDLPATMAALGELLGSSDAQARKAAMMIVADLGLAKTLPLFPRVVAQLGDTDESVRGMAEEYLRNCTRNKSILPYLEPAAELGGTAGRLWLAKELLAASTKDDVTTGVGRYLCAAITAEEDADAKQKLIALLTSRGFITEMNRYCTFMTNDQLLMLLASPDSSLSTNAGRILRSRVRAGADFTTDVAALGRAVVTKSDGRGVCDAWRILADLAFRPRGKECAAAMAAYKEGWQMLATRTTLPYGWALDRNDVMTAVSIARNDQSLLPVMLRAMIRRDDPLAGAELGSFASFPKGQPTGLGALLLALEWRNVPQNAWPNGMAYIEQGLQNGAPRVSFDVARVFLAGYRYGALGNAGLGALRDRAEACRAKAEQVVLAAFQQSDLGVRRQAVWIAGKTIDPKTLTPYASTIAETYVQVAVSLLAQGGATALESEQDAVTHPYRESGKQVLWLQVTREAADILKSMDLPDEDMKQVAAIFGH